MKRAVCPYNGTIESYSKVSFCDSTLREGELTPGAAFTYEEKKQFVRELDRIGINEFVVTSVGVNSKPDGELLQYIKDVSEMNLRMGMVFSVTGKDSVDFVAPFHPKKLRIVAFTSKYLNRGQPLTDESFQRNIDETVEMVRYIRSKGMNASVGLCDSTRANDEQLFRLIQEAAEAGASEISIVDTAGCATPEAMTYLVSNAKRILEPYSCEIGVHCHNDFGLALPNILAAIRAGAQNVDVCLNGLGDRCGNASLTEVVGALEFLYGLDSGIDKKALKHLSDLTAELSGIPLAGSTPLVGDYAFSHQQNVHITEYQHEHLAWQGIEAEEVGNETIVIFGKHSGSVSIDFECQKAGRQIDRALYPALLKRLREESEREKGTVLLAKDFWQIVDDLEKEQA